MVDKKKSGKGLLDTIKNTLSRGKSTSAPAEPAKATKKKPEVVAEKSAKTKKTISLPKKGAIQKESTKTPVAEEMTKAPPKEAPPVANQNPIDNIRDLFQKAIALHQQGNLPEAKKLCDQMIALDPKSFDAYHFLGIMAVQEKKMELASKMLTIAAEINPRVPQVHNNLGVILRSLGQFEKALDCVIKAVQLNPNYAEALNNQGVLYRDLGRYPLALKSFEDALKLKPDYEDAKSNYEALLKLQTDQK